ncbi:Rieske 2Fe-2S domain-containing protein [Streptomyces zagrosensis]|uniref:cholesterol 7-desaturase n=1 Tax=Streptomyces zagrosensis TaxID=1042984 RepID=A0A7W9V0N9_9ACTN|nr:Rieske 2Fe-2S domain-containing protein [Streptomyces zagrosensis]MBB5936959.1 nitrite reductase/ring-hydroxylating ferredoxin subunit [Streptomyces zagrosensis]
MNVGNRRTSDPVQPALPASQEHPTPSLPYPDGWFAVATSDEVKPGKVVNRRLRGQDVVLYRTTGGRLNVIRPFCPHLGAHLGHGGTVQGDNLVCPFHHFQFAPDGRCVKTGYGTPPPKAQLSALHFCEVDHLVFVWAHTEGKPPQWDVEGLLGSDFPKPHITPRSLLAHPQDVVENFIDVGHFGPLHGIAVEAVEGPLFEGRRLEVEYRLCPSGKGSGKRYSTLPTMRVISDGLGNIQVKADQMKFGFDMRARICVTPVEATRSDLRVSVALRPTGPGRRRVAGVVATLAPKVFARAAAADTKRDAAIWAHSSYVERPRLAKGDGPIMPFRRWAGQFYSGDGAPGSNVPAVTDVPAVADAPAANDASVVTDG